MLDKIYKFFQSYTTRVLKQDLYETFYRTKILMRITLKVI